MDEFILEKSNVANLWKSDVESPSGVFPFPERVREVEDNFSPGD